MRFAQPALMAMSAVDVHLRADKVSRLHRRHFVAGPLYNTAKFVSQCHWRLDSPLRPPVPSINVQIRPANRSRAHPHQHLARSNRRHRRIFKRKPARSLHLAQSFHRGWHGKAAPGRPIDVSTPPIQGRTTPFVARQRPTFPRSASLAPKLVADVLAAPHTRACTGRAPQTSTRRIVHAFSSVHLRLPSTQIFSLASRWVRYSRTSPALMPPPPAIPAS